MLVHDITLVQAILLASGQSMELKELEARFKAPRNLKKRDDLGTLYNHFSSILSSYDNLLVE